jgi:hypothetical protein
MKFSTVKLDILRKLGLGRKELRASTSTPQPESNMSTTRGIPENFPTQPVIRPDSMSAMVAGSVVAGSVVPPVTTSPFTAVGNAGASESEDFRKPKSPFQVAEPVGSFGFEATSPADIAAPPAAVSAVFTRPTPSSLAAKPVAAFGDAAGDSFSIRQLELRAIFGVDREMTPEEIIERCRALPGIQHIARVNSEDMGTIDALRGLMSNLGFGSGGLRLYADAVPLEFIREGAVLLAVQADGGFAPGVRETLMLVAREFGRPA